VPSGSGYHWLFWLNSARDFFAERLASGTSEFYNSS